MPWSYGFSNILTKVLLRSCSRWTVEGLEAVPPRGRLMVVANHMSLLDPSLLAVSLPRPIIFMAKRELFRYSLVGWLVRGYGAFPVSRNGFNQESVKRAIRVLAQEQVLGIFPEGARDGGRLARAKPGVAFIASRAQAPVLPVAITGTERVRNIWNILLARPKIHVRIGQPFILPVLEGPVGSEQWQGLADMMFARVAALLPEEYRGEYSSLCAAS